MKTTILHKSQYSKPVEFDTIMDEVKSLFNLKGLTILLDDTLQSFIDSGEVENLAFQVFEVADSSQGISLEFDQYTDKDLTLTVKRPNDTRQLEKRIDELMGRITLARLAIDKSDMNGLLYNLNQALES